MGLATAEQHSASLLELEDAKKKKKDGMSMDTMGNISAGITAAGGAMSGAIDGSNTDYNSKYGGQSESSQGMKNMVAKNTGAFGAVFSVFDAAGGVAGSAMNKGNAYDQDGYNNNEEHGELYMQMGGVFDPFSSGMRALEEGGEGSGLRALAGFTGLGGKMQYDYEQEQALERKDLRKKEEDSQWDLNQFNFTPNLDV